jgi:hypothetical protein
MKQSLNMNAQRLGIVTSLAIHGGFLFLLFMIQGINMIPNIKTIQINFVQQETLSTKRQESIKPAAGRKAKQIQNINKQENNEI